MAGVRRIGSVSMRALAIHCSDGIHGSSDLGCVSNRICGNQTRRTRLYLVIICQGKHDRNGFVGIQPEAPEWFS
jgi:hypothetical protein